MRGGWRREGPERRYLCGLGSLCLSLSCLIILKRPMRTSGRDTFIPFKVILQEEEKGGRQRQRTDRPPGNASGRKYAVVSMFCALLYLL